VLKEKFPQLIAFKLDWVQNCIKT